MQGYLYDPHTHTAETSKCGHLPAADVVERYVKHGFSGLVGISDIVILCRQLVNNILNKAHPHFHPHIQDSQIFYRILMAAYSKICCFRDNHHSNVFQE